MHRVSYYAIIGPDGDDPTVTKLPVHNIDPHLCTHIIIAFARVVNNVIVPGCATDIEVYKEVVALKKKNPKLKVLLSVGGSSPDPGFPNLVRDPSAIASFAIQAREFLVEHNLDGLDLDWEFPAWPVCKHDYREKIWFTRLVYQLNFELKVRAPTPFLLTIAVAGPKTIIDRSYEVDQLAQYVDFVSLMGYDYRIFWPYLPFTGHNAPLAKRRNEWCYFATLNIQWSANYWVKKGMPKEKLVVGVPTYGRTWKLLRSSWHSVGSPAVGSGMLNGAVTYPLAFSFVRNGAERYFDEESRVPYAVKDKDWVSYEDSESIREKAQWIKKSEFAGVMIWNLNSDDWAGTCRGKKFELHNIIKAVLNNKTINNAE
ncbi:acidic mammalian chitinase [Procambarus clarkii]|uniref:acidic mammalian chitinase n=1 Tax=Procambarus clarkii TaxID=6728 RepID=UPI003743711F